MNDINPNLSTIDRSRCKVKSIFQLDEKIDEDNVLALFVNLVILVEADADKNQYKLVKFYRDWLCHLKLERSLGSGIVLLELNKIIDEVFSPRPGSNFDNLPKKIYECMSFGLLRAEIDKVFTNYSIEVVITDKNWIEIINHFMQIVCDKDVSYDEANLRKLLASSGIRTENNPCIISNFSIVTNNFTDGSRHSIQFECSGLPYAFQLPAQFN